MKIIDLIMKNNIPHDISLTMNRNITDIGNIIIPHPSRVIDVVIQNIRVNHMVSAENVIVAETAELTVGSD